MPTYSFDQTAGIAVVKLKDDVCNVDISSYVNGADTFPCSSGARRKLTAEDRARINQLMADSAGVCAVNPTMLRKTRRNLERAMQAHIHEFYDFKDCLDWACSTLGISGFMLNLMYPTSQEYLALTEFRHVNDQ